MSGQDASSSQSVSTAITLLKRRERNLGRYEAYERMLAGAAVLQQLVETLGTEVTKRFLDVTISQTITMLDYMTLEMRELREQLLNLTTIGRNVQPELENLRLLDSRLEDLLHGANENLMEIRRSAKPEEVSRAMQNLKDISDKHRELFKELGGLQDRVNTRVADLFADVSILMKYMNADQVRQAFSSK